MNWVQHEPHSSCTIDDAHAIADAPCQSSALWTTVVPSRECVWDSYATDDLDTMFMEAYSFITTFTY